MSDNPVELLAEIYPKLENGDKAKFRQAKDLITELQAALRQAQDETAGLKSTIDRQPLPEAPVSMTAKVVDAATQIEWLVTVREARAARLLISAMPAINEALAGQGLIALASTGHSVDAYVDGRRAERQENKALPAPPTPGKPTIPPPAGDVKTGTGTLLQLTIDTSGKAEFKIDTLQYPLKDSRGAAAVASLFDPSLGWEPEHFTKPAIYTQEDFGQLKLDWKKASKYYDVARIYA